MEMNKQSLTKEASATASDVFSLSVSALNYAKNTAKNAAINRRLN
jgi:hypothetical protein